MDTLFIVRDALASSLVTVLLLAAEAKRRGQQVAVLFTQEALAALARGTFGWPRELSGHHTRLTIADRAKSEELPLLGRGEGRQLDVRELVSRARGEGLTMYACPVWSSLLGLEDGLPDGVERMETAALLDAIRDAGRIVGSL